MFLMPKMGVKMGTLQLILDAARQRVQFPFERGNYNTIWVIT
jgi:hypothetical protein